MIVKPTNRVDLVRSFDGRVWHRQTGTRAACGATLRGAITVSANGTPKQIVDSLQHEKLPLCPMCF